MTTNPQVPTPASALRAEVEASVKGGPSGFNRTRYDARVDIPEYAGQVGQIIFSPTDTGPWVKYRDAMDHISYLHGLLSERAALLRRCADRLREMEGELQRVVRECGQSEDLAPSAAEVVRGKLMHYDELLAEHHANRTSALMSDTWKVYNVDDCDWWVGRNAEEVKAAYVASYNLRRTDDTDVEPTELTEDDMQRLEFRVDDVTAHSFRVELERRVATGLTAPEFFASTEG